MVHSTIPASSRSEKSPDALAALRIPRRDEPKKPSIVGRAIRFLVVLGVILGLAYGGYLLAKQRGWVASVGELVPEAIRSLPEVRVARAAIEKGRSADALVVATGYLESRRQARIGARAAGRLEAVHVEEGSRVSDGEVIAVLEHKDMDAALAAARATLERARAELAEQEVEIARTRSVLGRAEELRKSGTNTVAEYDQAKFNYEGAVARRDSLQASVELFKARVLESEQSKENMIIRAPFDGTVISKDAEVGESILPGGMGEASGRGSVVTIADLEHLEVDCDVKEDYISRVVADAPAEVAVDAVPDRRYEGRVRKIIPMGDRARATIKVKVEILDADSRLFPDMSSTVYFLPAQQQHAEDHDKKRVFCESAAIQSEGNETFVWILNDQNRAQRIDVVTGTRRDGRAEVTEGLRGGERIVLNPPTDVTSGMLLRVEQ